MSEVTSGEHFGRTTPDDAPVGVAGAGVIGTGVAQNLAEKGHNVVLVDVADDILARAKNAILQEMRLQALLRKGAAIPHHEVLKRITFTRDYGALATCDFVIENVTETWEAKQTAYRSLEGACHARCVFIANTSCIPIARIAAATHRPSQVVGVHFMNPVPLKGVVELIPGSATSGETVQRTEALLMSLGKRAVKVADQPGFVSNRVLMPMINQAISLLNEGVASAEHIDLIFTACFGHKMGPLATADLIGLDTVLNSLEILRDTLRDEMYAPNPRLRWMVEKGQCGRKRGQGFYAYPMLGEAEAGNEADEA